MRGSEATLVEALVTARLLGVRILTVDAKVAVVPAAIRPLGPPAEDRVLEAPERPSDPLWRRRSATATPRLADALRTIDEGARVLAKVRRGGV